MVSVLWSTVLHIRGALYICRKIKGMRYLFCAVVLSICTAAYSQTIVGEAPEVLPEFHPGAVRDTVIVDEGFRYEGQYPDGKGVLYDINRGLFFGEFRGMEPHGQCTAYFIDGGRYQGEMRDGKENGYGHYFSASGKVFAGKFENNRAHGIDTLYYPDGRVFIGVVVKGHPNGYGEKYDSLPEKLSGRKPVFRDMDLTEEQKIWLKENHFVAPLFKGQRLSSRAFPKWVCSKLRYPRKASAKGDENKVYVEFWLDEQGRVTDAKILESGGEYFDKEVLRVMSISPKWTPAYRGGRPVRYHLHQRIYFYQPY